MMICITLLVWKKIMEWIHLHAVSVFIVLYVLCLMEIFVILKFLQNSNVS